MIIFSNSQKNEFQLKVQRSEVKRLVVEVEGLPCSALLIGKVPIFVYHLFRATNKYEARLTPKSASDLGILGCHIRTTAFERRLGRLAKLEMNTHTKFKTKMYLRSSDIDTQRELRNIRTAALCDRLDLLNLTVKPLRMIFIRNRPQNVHAL